jgi:excisionase family DNA binding protein
MLAEYYSPTEAAQLLSVSKGTILKLIKKKKIKAVTINLGEGKISRPTYRIPKEEIKNLINNYGSNISS